MRYAERTDVGVVALACALGVLCGLAVATGFATASAFWVVFAVALGSVLWFDAQKASRPRLEQKSPGVVSVEPQV